MTLYLVVRKMGILYIENPSKPAKKVGIFMKKFIDTAGPV